MGSWIMGTKEKQAYYVDLLILSDNRDWAKQILNIDRLK